MNEVRTVLDNSKNTLTHLTLGAYLARTHSWDLAFGSSTIQNLTHLELVDTRISHFVLARITLTPTALSLSPCMGRSPCPQKPPRSLAPILYLPRRQLRGCKRQRADARAPASPRGLPLRTRRARQRPPPLWHSRAVLARPSAPATTRSGHVPVGTRARAPARTHRLPPQTLPRHYTVTTG
jgi:hypothetical protein